MIRESVSNLKDSRFGRFHFEAITTLTESSFKEVPKMREEKILSSPRFENEKSKYFILKTLVLLDYSEENIKNFLVQQQALSFFLGISKNIETQLEIKRCKKRLEEL